MSRTMGDMTHDNLTKRFRKFFYCRPIYWGVRSCIHQKYRHGRAAWDIAIQTPKIELFCIRFDEDLIDKDK